MGVIIYKRIPDLSAAPESDFSPAEEMAAVISKAKSPFSGRVSPENLLHKILSEFRVLVLKTDNRTCEWLKQLRERSQKKRFGEDDKYWKKLRKSTKK